MKTIPYNTYGRANVSIITVLLLFLACDIKSVDSDSLITLEFERREIFHEIRDQRGVPYSYTAAIALGPDESVYLREIYTGIIHKIRQDGFIQKFIGRPGQGPGEFQTRSGPFYIDLKGDLYVLDQTRFVKFDCEGEFIRNIPAVWGVDNFFIGVEDVAFCTAPDRSQGHSGMALLRIEKGIVERLKVFPDEATTLNSGVSLSVRVLDTGTFLLRAFPDAGFCLADNRNFALYLYDPQGTLLKEMRIGREKIRIAAKEKARMRKAIEFLSRQAPGFDPRIPEYKTFFQQLLIDEKGRLFFLRKDDRERIAVEIFARSGSLLGKTELPFLPLVIRNDTFYSLDSNTDGEFIGLSSWKIRNPGELNRRR